MLKDKEIEKIKLKMLKKGINEIKLSNILFIPITSLKFCLKKKKDLPIAEKKLRYWISNQ